MAESVNDLLDSLTDAMLAREDSCHGLSRPHERDKAITQWHNAVSAIQSALTREPLSAASGEPVAWACYVDGDLWDIENDRNTAESFLENGDGSAVRSIRPLVFGDAPPSAAGVGTGGLTLDPEALPLTTTLKPSAAGVTVTEAQIDAGIAAVEQLRVMRQVFTAEQKRERFLRAAREVQP